MKCFYHKDADGMAAGFEVYKNTCMEDDYQNDYIGIDYKMKFPMDIISADEVVYIVDYSISPKEMIHLLTITKNVTWVDHHKTAIEAYANYPELQSIKGLRYDGVAACMLTYCYFECMARELGPFNLDMTNQAPLFIKLIADWDVWKFEYGDATRHFQTAFYAYDFLPTSPLWYKLNNSKEDQATNDLVNEGKCMMKYRDNWAKTYVAELGFETIFEDHLCFAMNLGMCNSDYFKSLNDKYDIVMPFSYDGEQYKFSMFSKITDVGEIALKYKGGGHLHAAGFQCDHIPFIKLIKEEKNNMIKPYSKCKNCSQPLLPIPESLSEKRMSTVEELFYGKENPTWPVNCPNKPLLTFVEKDSNTALNRVDQEDKEEKFKNELIKLINNFSYENKSNTPDYILAEYLCSCLKNFNDITNKRIAWYK